MKNQDVQKLYDEYILPTYTHIPLCLVKGKGSRVWDIEGNEFIDFFPGWGVSSLGHCHPAVVQAVKQQARKILHISNNFLNLKQAQLAREIVQASFPGRVFFCSSGAEAVEGAIKTARAYGAATGRHEIITMRKSFHGRTLATMTATGQDRIHQGFGPVPEGFRYAELNDLATIKAQMSDKTIAVLLEPVQGEGGINVATPGFMQQLRALCDEQDLLLMVDEIQCGMGRTGKWFGYQHAGIEPDVMALAKALGSGVPVGAFVVHKNKGPVLSPGMHGSTYGGNPLVAAGALAVFDTLKRDRLVQRAEELGTYLGDRLEQLKDKFPMITGVKGLGMMRALQLNGDGSAYVERAREKGLLVNCTQQTVIRILPSINISKKLLDRGLSILEEIFAEKAEKVTT